MRSTAETTAQWRAFTYKGDPTGDAAIRAFFGNAEITAVNQFFLKITTDNQSLPDDLDPILRRFLKTHAVLPDTVDTARLANATEIFGEYGFQVVTALFFASLPYNYCVPRGAEVLAGTGELVNDVTPRILKTARFIMAVCGDNGLGPTGEGLVQAHKVRLVHSAVRHMFLNQAHWDVNTHGMPVNQTYLAGTMLTFSLIVTDAMLKLGVPLTKQQQEDWLYLWTVVSELIGLDAELVPDNLAQARELDSWIRETLHATSPDGVLLTQKLLDWVEDFIPTPHWKGFPEALTWYLSGERIGRMVGITRPDWAKALIPLIQVFTKLTSVEFDHHVALRYLAERYSRKLMIAMTTRTAHGQDLSLQIPSTLAKRWELEHTR